jgi:hypothetical protein
MQQGQGFAHCHREEMVRAGPTANWTDQLTRLAIRDFYIDTYFSILWYRLKILDSSHEY